MDKENLMSDIDTLLAPFVGIGGKGYKTFDFRYEDIRLGYYVYLVHIWVISSHYLIHSWIDINFIFREMDGLSYSDHKLQHY